MGQIAAMLPLLIVTTYLVIQQPTVGDWALFFRPSTLNFIHGANPYASLGTFEYADFSAPAHVFNPVWTFIILAPLASLPLVLSGVVVRLIAFACYWTIICKLTPNAVMRVAFMYSAPVIFGLWKGQLDFLVLLAMLLPSQYGIWLASIKPQVGLSLLAWQLYDLYQHKRGVFEFSVVTMGLLMITSFAVYGIWLGDASSLVDAPWNTAISWLPLKIIIIALFIGQAVTAQSEQSRRLWLWAISPFLALYVGITSWVVVLLPLTEYWQLFSVAWLGFWIVYLVN